MKKFLPYTLSIIGLVSLILFYYHSPEQEQEVVLYDEIEIEAVNSEEALEEVEAEEVANTDLNVEEKFVESEEMENPVDSVDVVDTVDEVNDSVELPPEPAVIVVASQEEIAFTPMATLWDEADLFITTWDTRNTSTGSTDEESIKIPTVGAGYSGQVDWGDGIVEAFNGTAPVIQHTYTGDGGIKTVKIQGKFPRIYFVNTGDKLKLLSVEQWGDIAWTSMNGEFYGAENLQVFATDVPNLTNVKDMTNMFRGATNFNGDLSNRDVSKVTNFATMFYGDTIFNSDLSNWITNSGTNMSNMFVNAKAFNSDLSDWNVENVTTMANMFQWATAFNSDLSNRDVSKVTNFSSMFNGATVFESDLSSWITSSGTNMGNMFVNAKAFTSDLSNWDVSKVTNFGSMFNGATVFESDLSNWITGSWTNMSSMFANAKAFTSDLSNWNVENVTTMANMFYGASSFNGSLKWWNVEKVTTMFRMFRDATSFNGSLSGWNTISLTGDGLYQTFYWATNFNQPVNHFKTENITTLQDTFRWASIFNQPLDNWNVEKVTTMFRMFYYATSFDGSLSGWNTISLTGDGMINMFNGATNFNQPVNHFKTENLTTLDGTFYNASSFNQDVDNRDIHNVNSLTTTFNLSSNFNRPLNSWDVSKVTTMNNAFAGAIHFNQPLDNWDVSNMINMSTMFADANSFNQDISNWDTSNVSIMRRMFMNADSFNQDISNWDTSNVSEIYQMFEWAASFNQDLSNRDITSVVFTGFQDINFKGMFSGAGLSTYNYNQILIWRSTQNIQTGFTFGAQGIKYGGCNITNREAWISGHALLEAKGRTILDGGLEDCAPTPNGNGNWWGGTTLEKDYCPDGDLSPSYYDNTCDSSSLWGDKEWGDEANQEHNVAEEKKTLYQIAYERAKEYGITTASTYEDTRISDTILRQEMAKMISTYAIKLLNKIPDTSKVACAQFQDVSEVPAELQPYIIQSCELGLMGMHGDGIQVQDNFFPKSFISRAEVGTILSRLLRGTTYATQEGDETYYSRHLQALKKAGIMNFISNPDMLELRGNILLMLWKSVTK